MEERTCGDCTMCCTLLGVEELDKPQHQACVHDKEHSCSIYADRPQSCRNFVCSWLENVSVPAEFKPNKCGAVMYEPDVQPLPNTHVDLIVMEDTPGSARTGLFGLYLQQLMERGTVVCLVAKN